MEWSEKDWDPSASFMKYEKRGFLYLGAIHVPWPMDHEFSGLQQNIVEFSRLWQATNCQYFNSWSSKQGKFMILSVLTESTGLRQTMTLGYSGKLDILIYVSNKWCLLVLNW